MNNISPHVSIYKFPITAISSITNRLTGIYLSGLFVLYGNAVIMNKHKILDSLYLNCEKYKQNIFHYSILIPTNYHLLGGLRHFILDARPYLLKNKIMTKSSYSIFGLTLINSIIMENSLKYLL